MTDGLRARTESLFREIEGLVSGPTALMEVCGTHTTAIHRFGLRARLPQELRLLSGPGCPVCVTPSLQIDQSMALASQPGVVVATFGDMMRVPGSSSTLQCERSVGRDVVVVSSPLEALDLAQRNPAKLVVFIGVGFETTSPTIAATLVQAAEKNTDNFFVLCAFKVIPPALELLATAEETRIDGFICPGHVSTIIGSEPYGPVATEHNTPCVIAGFEAADILQAVVMLLEQIRDGRHEVEIQYSRAVQPAGNPVAGQYLERVFRVTDADWRGIGEIPLSGLELSEEFASFDALARIPVDVPTGPDLPRGCSCGEVMLGLKSPIECPLFGTACTPAKPTGPCMVSSEGACAAWFRFGGVGGQ